MSQQAAKRRRSQARIGYTHLAPMGRPKYRHRALLNVQAAIAHERQKAARAAAASKKK